MLGPALASVYAHAALPQKVTLMALVAAFPVIVAATGFGLASHPPNRRWRQLVATIRFIGPGLGLLVGAMNSFHMAQTIQRVPFDPTAKQLAPGILEVSTFVGLGALVGLTAVTSSIVITWTERRRSPV